MTTATATASAITRHCCLTGLAALPSRDVLAVAEAHAQALAQYRSARGGACYAEISLVFARAGLAIAYLHGETFYFRQDAKINRAEFLAWLDVAKLVPAVHKLQWED